jgi:hypothetical protein
MARKKQTKPGYKVVGYGHTEFSWQGRTYNLNNLTVGQANVLLNTGWPYIRRVTAEDVG